MCSHCFPVTLNQSQHDVYRVDGANQAYVQSIRYVCICLLVCLFVCFCFGMQCFWVHVVNTSCFFHHRQKWSRCIIGSNLVFSHAERGMGVQSIKIAVSNSSLSTDQKLRRFASPPNCHLATCILKLVERIQMAPWGVCRCVIK